MSLVAESLILDEQVPNLPHATVHNIGVEVS